MDKVTSPLKSQILSSMKLKDTDKLISIWMKNNRAEWSDVAFEVVKEILLERGQVLPEQHEPNFVNEDRSTNANLLQRVSISTFEFIKNNRKVFTIFCFFLVVGTFLVIVNNFNAKQLHPIPSLKDNWEKLESSAHSWQADAYLTNVSFNIAGQGHYPIEAEYHSQNEQNQLLVIGIDKMGKIVYLPIDLPSSSSGAQDPIYREDFEIDSQEALNIFAKKEEIRACLVKPSGAQIMLMLNQVMTENISWQLATFNCQDKDGLYFLDAKTGEVIWKNQ